MKIRALLLLLVLAIGSAPRLEGRDVVIETGNLAGAVVAANQANELLKNDLRDLKRVPFEKALHAATTHRHDYLGTYITDLANVLDMDAIRAAGVHMGVDPLGGAGVHYWGRIAATN